MHYYQHNIKDFNNDTRHLTHVERALYRDAIELYYDSEQPLVSDKNLLARKLLARTESEIEALEFILNEFFYLHDGAYHHTRCDAELEKYKANTSAKAKAGKASAEARRKKKEQKATGVEQVLDNSTTDAQLTNNHKPITNNHLIAEPAPPAHHAQTKKPAKRKTKLPEDFTLTVERGERATRYWATKRRSDLDVMDAWQQFISHHKSKGSVMACWDSAWNTWYRNQINFIRQPKVAGQQTRDTSIVDNLTDDSWATGMGSTQ